MDDERETGERETGEKRITKTGPFGEIVRRLLPEGVKMSRLLKLVDISNPHFYGVLAGERDGKPVSPSPTLTVRFIRALEDLGATVTDEDKAALMEQAVDLPEGFRVSSRGHMSRPSDDPGVDLVIQVAAYDNFETEFTPEELRHMAQRTQEFVETLVLAQDARKKRDQAKS